MILLKLSPCNLMHQLCHFNWLVGLLKTKIVQGVNNFFSCMLMNYFEYAFESNKLVNVGWAKKKIVREIYWYVLCW